MSNYVKKFLLDNAPEETILPNLLSEFATITPNLELKERFKLLAEELCYLVRNEKVGLYQLEINSDEPTLSKCIELNVAVQEVIVLSYKSWQFENSAIKTYAIFELNC